MIYFSLGILLIILGLIFLLIPLEKLRTVFRRMRSSVTTKIGGAVFVVMGIMAFVLGLQQ